MILGLIGAIFKLLFSKQICLASVISTKCVKFTNYNHTKNRKQLTFATPIKQTATIASAQVATKMVATEESIDVKFHPPPPGSFADDDSEEDLVHDTSNSKSGSPSEYKHVSSQVKKENFFVKLGKSSVILSILIAGLVVSTLTFVSLSRALEKDGQNAVS